LQLSHETSKTPIARFHSSKGMLKPTKPFLEISDEQLDSGALDAVVVSLVFVEKKRRPMEDDVRVSETRYASTVYMANRA
jgi:hypothetical protein